MFNMHPAQSISALVNGMLRPYSDPEKGLLICLDCGAREYIPNYHEVSSRRRLYFLFVRASNFTTVWFDSKPFPGKINNQDWDHICHHDSCWRDSVEQVINKEYFSMCNEIMSLTGNIKAPKDINTHCSFDIFEKPRFVRAVTELVEDPNWTSRMIKMPKSIWKWSE